MYVIHSCICVHHICTNNSNCTDACRVKHWRVRRTPALGNRYIRTGHVCPGLSQIRYSLTHACAYSRCSSSDSTSCIVVALSCMTPLIIRPKYKHDCFWFIIHEKLYRVTQYSKKPQLCLLYPRYKMSISELLISIYNTTIFVYRW